MPTAHEYSYSHNGPYTFPDLSLSLFHVFPPPIHKHLAHILPHVEFNYFPAVDGILLFR